MQVICPLQLQLGGNPNSRFVKDSITDQETAYKCDDFYYPNDEGGLTWNAPTIVVVCPGVMGEYKGTASAEGYSVDGVALNLSDKNRKWVSIKDTFKF